MLGLWRVNGRVNLFSDDVASWNTRVAVGSGDIILVYRQRDTSFSLDRPRWDGVALGKHVIVHEHAFNMLTWLPCDGMESFSL